MLRRALGMIGLAVMTLLVITFSGSDEVVVLESPGATSTLAIVPTKVPRALEPDDVPIAKPASTSQIQKPTLVATPKTAPAVEKTLAATPVPQPNQNEFEAVAATLRGALVNILCLSGRQDIHSISGSGVIIDPRGIIVTNAHIAQYYLYTGDKSLEVSCVVRTGSPARSMYQAKLMYLPQAWVAANKNILTTTNPKGNGEFDFALLAITGSAATPLQTLPDIYPYIPLSTTNPSEGLPVVVGAYAGEFVTSEQIQSAFYPTVVFGTIRDIATYVASTIDIITVDGSAASQSGSSGGGIARTPGELAGVITTSTHEVTTADRVLAGITASYIKRHYLAETGSKFEEMLAKSPIEVASEFAPDIADLRATLTASISH